MIKVEPSFAALINARALIKRGFFKLVLLGISTFVGKFTLRSSQLIYGLKRSSQERPNITGFEGESIIL